MSQAQVDVALSHGVTVMRDPTATTGHGFQVPINWKFWPRTTAQIKDSQGGLAASVGLFAERSVPPLSAVERTARLIHDRPRSGKALNPLMSKARSVLFGEVLLPRPMRGSFDYTLALATSVYFRNVLSPTPVRLTLLFYPAMCCVAVHGRSWTILLRFRQQGLT